MHGKVPGNPDFKCWSIEPAGEWNYAVDLTEDVKPLSDEVVYLDLVPYGGTELRLTVFPIVK